MPLTCTTMAKPSPAVILAAGASVRLGQPKSLVRVGEETLVGLAHQRLIKAGCSPILVVTRQELSYDVMQAAPGATVVVNSNPERGRTGSLQCGFTSLVAEKGRTPRSVIIAPVDRPGWTAAHVRALLKSTSSSTLMCEGRKGHPMLIDATGFAAVLSAKQDVPLRDIVTFEAVEVIAPLMHLNIDTPADLEHLAEHAEDLLRDD